MVRVRVRVTAALEKVCTISVLLLVNVLLCHDLAQKLEVTSFALRSSYKALLCTHFCNTLISAEN